MAEPTKRGYGRGVDEAQRATERRFDSLHQWLSSGVMKKSITFTDAEEVRVSHGLRRSPEGWLALRPRSSDTADLLTEVSSDDGQLVLKNNPATTPSSLIVDLWIW